LRALLNAPSGAVKLKKNHIPDADAAGALSVCDGTEFVGTVVACHGTFFSFDVNDNLLGSHKSQIEAMRSIPPPHPLHCKQRGRR
jgi:hypothetical protein